MVPVSAKYGTAVMNAPASICPIMQVNVLEIAIYKSILSLIDIFALHFRFIVSILFRCCLVNHPAVDMLCGRISAFKTALAATGLSFNNTKTFVFCGFHCRFIARRLFYDPGKFEMCII